MMNPDGKCYTFDDRGRGYGRGEGFGALVLKRFDEAVRDGDQIHAVIANSGVNQDGKTVGISLPSGEAQEALARSVYAAAGLNPGQTVYVEAHGTVRRLLLLFSCVPYSHRSSKGYSSWRSSRDFIYQQSLL
jgi:acyl transferase domain-containing protein